MQGKRRRRGPGRSGAEPGLSGTGAELPWEDVGLFLALVRGGSLGAAGKVLRVDASTVSRRLDRLEERLKRRLFERGRTGVSPTPAGAALVSAACGVEEAMFRFAGEIELLDDELRGEVRLACPPDLAGALLVPALAEFRRRHPRVVLEILEGAATVAVARQEVDVALRTSRPRQGDVIVQKVASFRWVLAGSVQDEHWRRWPWITWGLGAEGAWPARWFSERSGQLSPVLRTNNLEVQMAAVEAGLGVAWVPEPSALRRGLHLLEPGQLEGLKGQEQPLYLVAHRSLRRVPRVDALWTFLQELLGTLASG